MSAKIITKAGHEALYVQNLDYLWREHRPELRHKVTWAEAHQINDGIAPAACQLVSGREAASAMLASERWIARS